MSNMHIPDQRIGWSLRSAGSPLHQVTFGDLGRMPAAGTGAAGVAGRSGTMTAELAD
jgi:hypothetical protein